VALKRETYKAFEGVLGVENVSEDPAILDSYAWRSGMNVGLDNFLPRFEAVTLPKDTEEVQAIVKLCNHYGLKFKASSTGWGFMNDPHHPGVIKIDLRRMNRILEINEKNMYAVVEPYVIFAQLQAELMKRGLNCNVTGAGANCSALPVAAHEGIGHMSQSTSYGERNQLALEWVTPNGEIIRLGSLAAVGEWFCGDGPGPSLRGIVRGHVTPLGGLGVYTKAAFKIYHWPGPATFPIEGVSPNYAPSQIPERFMIRYISFPSIEDRFEALRRIGESEIALEVMGFAPSMVAANMATSNQEDMAYLERINRSVQGPGFQIIIAGNSRRDFEYKKRVLEQIMTETRGKSLDLMEDPKIGGGQLWRCLRITGSIRETLRATGAFGGVVGGTDQLDILTKYIQETAGLKADLIKRGLVLDDGAMPFVQVFEHGHYGHAELLIRYDPKNPETQEAMGQLMMGAIKTALTGRFGVPHFISGDELHDHFGPLTSSYHLWLRGIKKVFDPEGASLSDGYISAKE
jgi:glycolate oxidase